jgi:hypothetical protein
LRSVQGRKDNDLVNIEEVLTKSSRCWPNKDDDPATSFSLFCTGMIIVDGSRKGKKKAIRLSQF